MLKDIPSDKRARLGDADYLVAIRVVARLQYLHNKKMAILLWEGDEAYALFGACKYSGKTLYLSRGRGRKRFVIYRDWHPKIIKTSGQQARLLDGSRYSLSLTVGPLPLDVDSSGFLDVGVRLPPDNH